MLNSEVLLCATSGQTCDPALQFFWSAGLQRDGGKCETTYATYHFPCRLLACIWAFLVVVDIAIYVSPGAGRHCPKVDGAENPSSAQLRDAFSAVLVAHIVHIWLCGIAWISMEEIAKWPDGNEEKAELQGRSETELKQGYILVVYFLLGVAAFISAWITKSNGYSSLSNISAVDCLHGAFRLAWIYSLLWFANIV